MARRRDIYKKGDQSLLQNCRPISLLSLFHKILEKLMANRLTNFITANSLLNDYQFGFNETSFNNTRPD